MRYDMRRAIACGLALSVLAVFGVVQSVASAPTDLIFLIADNAPVETMTLEDLQNVYLGKKRAVANFPILPIDQSETEPIKLAFLKNLLHMTHSEYRAQLLKRRFREGAVTPTFVANSTEALKAVRETPGGIGYVYQSEVGSLLGLKVLATVPTK